MMETILEVPEMGFETTQKIIQQQLVLILHAHGCQQQEFKYSHDYHYNDGQPGDIKAQAPKEKCKLPFCQETKQSLDHIRCCFEPESCQVSHCTATREIIRHWKTCVKKSNCHLCRPVYQAQIKGIRSRRASQSS